MTTPHTTPPATERISVPAHELEALARLRRVRDGVRVVLALGIAASVAANILHAEPSIIGRAVAAWPPIALLLAIELLSRVPVHRAWLAAVRMTATAAVAGIAAWVSYWHMVSVAAAYGETPTSAHLIPISVDGLVVVASVCLVELGARLHSFTEPTERTGQTEPGDPPAAAEADSTPIEAVPAPVATSPGAVEFTPAVVQPISAPAGLEPVSVRTRPSAPRGTARAGARGGATAAAITRTQRQHPDWTTAQIAARVGVTDRTVRRHLTSTARETTTDTPASSGRAVERVELGQEVAA